MYKISRAPGILGFLGNMRYQGQDALFGAVYAHKGRTKKLQRHGSNCFPLDILRTFKKNCVARKYLFKKNAGWTSFGLIMFQTVSDRFRPFPTVSDRFHFSERLINWTNSVYGRLIQCKPMKTMTLKFFRAILVRVDCTKYCILTLISHIP